jgi:hypothetical protein
MGTTIDAAANKTPVVRTDKIPLGDTSGVPKYYTVQQIETDALAQATSTTVGLGNVTNVAQLPISYLSTDGAMTADSATLVPAQSAVVTYVAAQLSAFLSGLTSKGAVVAISTGNIAGSYSTGVFTVIATGALTIDGVSPAVGQFVALVGQTGTGGTGTVNGIYVVTTAGTTGVSPVLTRASNYNTSANVAAGTYFIVSGGTTNKGTFWVNTTTGAVTLDTTALVFTEVTVGSLAASALTGTTLASNIVTSSLTTVGTLANLTVTGTIVGSINGNAATSTTATTAGTCTGNASTVTTNANLTGMVTSVGNATTVVTNANLSGDTTSSGNTTTTSKINGIIQAGTAATVTSNATTLPVTTAIDEVTNSSAATLTLTLATSGAVNGQKKIIQVLDFSAVAQTLTFVNTENSTVSVPTTSNGSTTLPISIAFLFNTNTTKWRCVGVS